MRGRRPGIADDPVVSVLFRKFSAMEWPVTLISERSGYGQHRLYRWRTGAIEMPISAVEKLCELCGLRFMIYDPLVIVGETDARNGQNTGTAARVAPR